MIEEERTQRRRELSEAAGGSGDGFGFRSTKIGELRNLTPAARRMLQARARFGNGGGTDAMGAIGENRFVETMNILATDVRVECLKLARRDPDAKTRLDAWLTDHAQRGSGVAAVPIAWIADDAEWTVHGVRARLNYRDPDEPTLNIDGDEFELRYLDHIPMDRKTIKLVKRLPRMTTTPPF